MAMQEIVAQILEGKYDYEISSLDFSCAKLEITMRKGEVCEGSFHIYSSRPFPARGQGAEGSPGDGSSAEVYTHGFVSATDMRMECLTPEFVGSNEEIFYRFHGESLEEGDVVKGNFCVVSNQGEYYLPFVVSVEHLMPESSIGSVKNLFHFANLAKSSWQEAVELFYSPEFSKVFDGNNSQFYDCYRGLSAVPGNEQNVEEFLFGINKKQRTEFLVRERELCGEFDTASYGVAELELNITRNGWGYTALQVECEGDFVFTEKEFLGDVEFLGNRCVLPVFIDTQLCRRGKNFGRVYLYNSHTAVTIPVTVRIGEASGEREDRLQRKRDLVRLMERYQEFRMRKISTAVWMQETGGLVESMVARDENDIEARLFQAQLLISEERYNEAGWILEHTEEEAGENDTLWAYYLYLTTLIRREEDYVNQIAAQVQQLYERDRGDWRIAWLLLYLSEEYNKTAITKWDFLEKQFEMGGSSPILYIEGLHLLNANPTLLRRLDNFALQVMYYGARRENLNPEILERLVYLCGRGKDSPPVLLRLLQKLYDDHNDVRLLQEICAILVRTNCVGERFFRWYQAGVEAQLRITNLYEYYMMSLDLENARELPRMVLMYFSYQNHLDLAHSAFLYWYVAQHKYTLGELYDSYKPRMEHFVVDQIRKGRINRHLAGLYQELLSPAMVDEQTAEPLAKLLFAHRICVSDLRLKKVVVCQPGNLQESVYPLQEGCTWLPLYGNDSVILFEDAYRNRFVRDVEYTLEKLMIPGRFLRMISGMVKNCRELDLYMDENERETERLSEESRDRKQRLAADELVDVKIRRKLYLRLLKHYYDTDALDALDVCLETIPMELFSLHERSEILRFMVLRDRLDAAWDWVAEFGAAFVEPKSLVRLLSERVARTETEDPLLAGTCLFSFRQGKYDSRIVDYLARYARCSTRELRDIWKAARSFELEEYELTQRLIVQMLFAGVFVGEKMDIFAYYVSLGADPLIEEAFLARCAYDYLVKEQLTEGIVFREICLKETQGEEIPRVCRLAFLKYYAENLSEIDETVSGLIEVYLREALAEKIHLNFFRNYIGVKAIREPLLRELLDKTIVEYRGRPGAKATIHYVILREDGETSEYLTEPMREVCGGFFFKEFVLFFGESLQYYIMEGRDGEEQLTESGNLQKSDIAGDGTDWRYTMLNDILISRTLEEFDTLDGLLDEYYRREYLDGHLFVLQ